MESGSVVHDEVGITGIGHPTAPYPSLGSGRSHPIDFGRPAGLSSMEILPVGPSKPFLGRWRLKLGVRAANFNHAGEQKHRSRWGIGFLRSDQVYSEFIPAHLEFSFLT